MLPKSKEAKNIVRWIKLTWLKLKIVVSSFHELLPYVKFMWQNVLTPDGQTRYSDAMDFVASSRPMLSNQNASAGDHVQIDVDFGEFAHFLETLPKDSRLWVPLSTFPLWDIESEGKMHLSMIDAPVGKGPDVRAHIKKFLAKYAPTRIYLPSPMAAKKVGNQRYNDGGTVRKDSERPKVSYNSGFLYQRFITKPNQTRECWLPGKATKDNNGWWFIVVDQILHSVPYSALLKEADDIHQEIHDQLTGWLEYFDISGFGLQFPREYLSIAIDEIRQMYPSGRLSSQADIAQQLFAKVEVEMEPGEFVYPPRGIGLGYYENLKTLVIMALIDDFKPISAYGDQAILPFNFGKPTAAAKLEEFGFLFTKAQKQLVYQKQIKWSGYTMTKDAVIEPRSLWSSVMGAFNKTYHWERKQALLGCIIPDEFKHVLGRINYHYERCFGPEFYKGESFCNPINLGLNRDEPHTEGWIKDWKVSQLSHPNTKFVNGYFMNVPFGDPPKKGEAKRFSLKRKKAYKNVKPFDSTLIHYVEPLIKLNNKRKPSLSVYARTMPLWADIRTFLFEDTFTGKITSGLRGNECLLAPVRQMYAPDPWSARATGGYEILTSYRGTRGPDEDLLNLAEALVQASVADMLATFRRDRNPDRIQKNPYLIGDEVLEEQEVANELLAELQETPKDTFVVPELQKSIFDSLKSLFSTKVEDDIFALSDENQESDVIETHGHLLHENDTSMGQLLDLMKMAIPDVDYFDAELELPSEDEEDPAERDLVEDYEALSEEDEPVPAHPTIYGWKY